MRHHIGPTVPAVDQTEPDIATAATWLGTAKRVLVFTGAGISAESGIPTFRDDKGLWDEFPVYQFATWPSLIQSMILNPQRLAGFLLKIIEPILMAEPNGAHRAVRVLEEQMHVVIATQNIDGLHQQAGAWT